MQNQTEEPVKASPSSGALDVREENQDRKQLDSSLESFRTAEPPRSTQRDENDQDDLCDDTERRIAFTDAVIAIAITLLILPLMDDASDSAELSVAEWYSEQRKQIGSFLKSFFVVASFWQAHSRLFALVRAFSNRLALLNFLWMLCMVYTPVATALIQGKEETGAAISYILVLMLARALAGFMAWEVQSNKQLWRDGTCNHTDRLAYLLVDAVVDTAICGIALGLCVTPVDYSGLLLLILGPFTTQHVIKKWPKLLRRA